MIPNYYEFQNSSKIISGEFSLESIPKELEMLNSKSVLLISDKTLNNIGTVQTVIDAMYGSNIQIKGKYVDAPADSSIEIINDIVELYKDLNCDSLLAIGGGTVIDTAKGVRKTLSQNKENIMELAGCEVMTYGNHIPFVAVPTTSGTGSEATLVAVILDKIKNIKQEFISYFLVPDVAILDARMTISLPPKITASTGMDALCHSIESYSCLQKNPLSDAYSISAIELIRDNLINSVIDGKDKKIRLAMANASLMAGISFSNSMVGLVHAIGHALGGVCHVPHGEAMAILMPHVFRFNKDKLNKEYSKLLLYIAGPEVYVNTPEDERAEKMIECVEELLDKLNKLTGLPMRLKDEKVNREDFASIARTALNDGAIIVNPKEAEFNDIIDILDKAY